MPTAGKAGVAASLIAIVLVAGACGSSDPGVAARKIGATSTTSLHTSDASTDSTSDSEGTTSSSTTSKASTTTTTSSSPTTVTQRSSGDVLTFDDLWARREELAGTSLTVDGKVLFNVTCPPQMPAPGGCNAAAWLTGDGVDDLGPDPSAHAMRLYDNGAAVSCASDQSAGLECKGWRQGGRYRLDGVPDHEIAGGREISTFRFNTTHHTFR